MKWFLLAVSSVAILFGGHPAHGTLIKLQFQFYGAGGTAFTGTAATNSPAVAMGAFTAGDTYWNPIANQSDAANNAGGFKLTDGSTTASGVTMQGVRALSFYGWGNGFAGTGAGAFTGTSGNSFYNTALLQSDVEAGDDIAFRINGLKAGTYEVFAIDNVPTAQNRAQQISIGVNLAAPLGAGYLTEGGGSTPSDTSWIAGDNYVVSTVTITGPTDWLTVISQEVNGTADFNGIQIDQLTEIVPEPSTLLLLGFGGLLVWRRMRKGFVGRNQ